MVLCEFEANACKANKIEAIQKQLKHKPKKAAKKKNVEILMLELTGKDITLCPVCKQGKLKRIREIQPKLSKMLFDTS